MDAKTHSETEIESLRDENIRLKNKIAQLELIVSARLWHDSKIYKPEWGAWYRCWDKINQQITSPIQNFQADENWYFNGKYPIGENFPLWQSCTDKYIAVKIIKE